jgi:amino acid adenylation domain-containing protein
MTAPGKGASPPAGRVTAAAAGMDPLLSAERQELLDLLLAQAGLAGAAPPAAAIPRRPDDARFRLSCAQEQLWLLDRLRPGSPAYNLPLGVALAGALDRRALAASLGEIVRRHETLRVRVVVEGGVPVAAVAEPQAVRLPLVDLAPLPPAAARDEAARLAAAVARRPFDLARGPLWRCLLLRLGELEHRLLLPLHHLAADGWSLGVLIRELGEIYAGLAAGRRRAALPDLPVRFGDFAEWQRGTLAGEAAAPLLAWWRDRLAGSPPVLELPGDRPRPAVSTGGGGRGGRRSLPLPPALVHGLASLGRARGATLFATLLAGFAALLCRYSGQRDLVVGTPVAGRGRVELEGLIGHFVNTLALRAEVAPEAGFGEAVDRARAAAEEALTHQDLPFARLVEELAPERLPGVTPIFQVLFALQNLGLGPVRLPGLTVTVLELETGSAKFDLSLLVDENGPELVAHLEYSADLFDAATAARWLAHYHNLLAAAAADPALALSRLPLLAAAERQQLAVEWSDAPGSGAPEASLCERFAAQAARFPDRLAVARGADGLTYGELDAAANRLARRLRRLGVGPEVVVGCCLDRSPELVVALLAILKAGGAYLPLDPAYPRQRLAAMLAAVRSPLLLCDERWLPSLPETAARIVCLQRVTARPGRRGARPLDPPPHREQLACVIFTSGSTGGPKAVGVVHRAILRLVVGTGYASFSAAEVFLQAASLSFDASTFEIWGPLLNGGRLQLLAGHPPSLAELAAAVALHGVTTLWLTAGLFHQMVERHLEGLRPLRQLLAGGEVLSPPHVRRVVAELPRLALSNGYGPTESTTFACCQRLAPADLGDSTIPIGRPITGTRAYVLDEGGGLAPPGAVGELYLGGAGLARGYLGRAGRTAERFVPDGLSGLAGERLYRTGDRVRHGADGRLQFLGRVDRQVKLRGFRVELGEIEEQLAGHAAVRQAVAGVVETAAGDRQSQPTRHLVAWVASSAPWRELRRWLGERLPGYMVPGVWVELAALPLSPNGKVDRRALEALAARAAAGEPAAAGEGAAGPTAGEAGWVEAAPTPVEELLCGIFADLLGRRKVGRQESFFDLGGHSLLATQVVSRVRESLGVELPLAAVFASPSVAQLAAQVAAGLGGGGGEPGPVPGARQPGELPALSFAQQRLWFLARLGEEEGTGGEAAAYHVPAALRLVGRLQVGLLRRALDEVVRRHEALRTAFVVVEGGEPRQAIAAAVEMAVAAVDLGALPAAARWRELRRRIDEEALRPFDLQRAPLLRASLWQLAGEEHALLVTLSHLVVDGWALALLVEEVAALYGAWSRGEPSPLGPVELQYADYTEWQRRWLTAERLERELAYWRQRLAGAPARLALPLDRPRGVADGGGARGGSRGVGFDAALTAALRALGRGADVTLFMTLLAGWQALLGRLCDSADVVVGSPVANRTRLGLERVMGCLVNTVVLRGDLRGDPSFAELLARVRETALAAYAHQELPFDKLVEALVPHRDLASTPLFQVLFTLQNLPSRNLRLPGLRVEPLAGGALPPKFDLGLTLEEAGEGLAGGLEYRAALFDAATAERFGTYLAALLAAAAADPRRRLSELALLGAAERHQLLDEWNDTAAAAAARPVHELVAAQAARTPEAPAVIAGGECLSYRELMRRAAGLAATLRGLGLGPEDLVAVALRRSAALPVALLGVLQAGAAYLPLDLASPPPRLTAVLAQARPRLILTQEALLGSLPDDATPVLCLDPTGAPSTAGAPPGPAALPFSAPGAAVPGGAGAAALAYAIFTSGSTGEPKGVLISHRALARHALSIGRRFGLGSRDRVSQLASASFDVAAEELYPAWLCGAAVVLYPEESAAPDEQLLAFIARERVTVLNLAASFWQAWANLLGHRAAALPPDLRLVVVGSEPVPVDLFATWQGRRGGGPRMVNAYGPTEATVTCALFDGDPEPARSHGSAPVGRPLDGAAIHLLDAHLQPVPRGAAAELYIGGEGLARGYLGRPALTAERFLPDPFSRLPGGRLYRSGDLARRLPGGDLEVLGRADEQVKVRGFRIELAEIEAALGTQPAVRAAAVAARDDAPGGRQLVAYLVASGGEEPSPAELRAHLAQRLPPAMVPAIYLVLPSLPTTPGGKLDRRALPPPAAAAPGRLAPASRTPVEELLIGIWEELLGVAGLGGDDDFFAHGGHSLLAVQLVSRVRDVLGVELPLRQLFATPTPAALAPWLAAAGVGRAGAAGVTGGRGPVAAPPPLAALPRAGDPPLSFAQQRIWLIDRLMAGSPFYNQAAAIELAGALQPGVLARTFHEIARRHEVLRTTFQVRGEQPVQVVGPPAAPCRWIDLAALPAAAREAEIQRLALDEARRPFDLAGGPLLRLVLLRLGEMRHVLLLTLHHIVSDGWSIGVLVREVAALYPALAAGRPSPLPEPRLQYADYALWQRRWLEGELLESHLAYWRRQLAGSPPALALPTDHRRPAVPTYRGARRRLALPAGLEPRLRELCRRERVTLFMLLLGAFETLLWRFSGQQDFVVGAAVAGRGRLELEGLIGCFVNLLPLRAALAGDPPFRELLARVRESTLGAFAHQDLPFELLAAELGWARAAAGRPLVEVAFGIHNAPADVPELPGFQLTALDLDPGAARFDLTLWMLEEPAGLDGLWTWSTDLFTAATVESLHGRFVRLLESIVAAPATRLSALAVASAAEQQEHEARLGEWREAQSAGLLAARRRSLRHAGA